MIADHPLHGGGYRPPFDSPVHRLDPRVKLLAAVGFVVAAVSVPPDRPIQLLAYAVVLLAALAIARVPAGYAFRRWLVVVPFLAAGAALPFVRGGPWIEIAGLSLSQPGLVTLCMLSAKSSLAVAAMACLTASTHPGDLLAGLARLGVPRTLTLIMGLTWRYLFVLGEEAMRMKRARDLRHYGGRWLWQAGVVGQMVGTLFIRSVERGERVHAAMLARGFDGTFRPGHQLAMRTRDWIVLAAWFVLVVIVRVFV